MNAQEATWRPGEAGLTKPLLQNLHLCFLSDSWIFFFLRPAKDLETASFIALRFEAVEKDLAHLEEQKRPEPQLPACSEPHFSQVEDFISGVGRQGIEP